MSDYLVVDTANDEVVGLYTFDSKMKGAELAAKAAFEDDKLGERGLRDRGLVTVYTVRSARQFEGHTTFTVDEVIETEPDESDGE